MFDSPSGELRVRMLASPINPSDLMMIAVRTPYFPSFPARLALKVWIVEAAGPGLLGKYYRGKRVAMLVGEGGCWLSPTSCPPSR